MSHTITPRMWAPIDGRTAHVLNVLVWCVLALIAVVLGGLLVFNSTTGSPAADNPALAQAAHTALTSADAGAAVRDVSAESNGDVNITLTVTKGDLGGAVQAEAVGWSLANIVLAATPGARRVVVADADLNELGSFDRQ